MILLRGSFTGPLNGLVLCNHAIKWVTHARLLGVTIDNNLTWSQHIFKLKKSFVNKLNLLKRSFFYHVINSQAYILRYSYPLYHMRCRYGEVLPTSKDGFLDLKSLHCRATKGAFHLSEQTSQSLPDVMRISLLIKTIKTDQ